MEIHGPKLMGMLSTVTLPGAVSGTCPLSILGSGPLQAFIPPKQLHPLVIDSPALPYEQAVGLAPAPADVFRCVLPKRLAEQSLLDVDNLAGMELGAAVLPHDAPGLAFRNPVTLLQGRDSPATTFRARKFHTASSLSMAASSSASARSFFRRTFSFTS